jgi:hypothetical protein
MKIVNTPSYDLESGGASLDPYLTKGKEAAVAIYQEEPRLPGTYLIPLLALVLGLVGTAIAVWAAVDDTGGSERDALLLTLFALAGALGGVLRSLGYLLAFGSFTVRERRQWVTEAFVAPVLGAAAGLAAFLLVRASLVEGSADVNRSGQFLLSVAVGALALAVFGRVVERGLLRGSMSRSGILGAEVSPSVPILSRLEQMLEQRVADLTIVNYDGHLRATAHPIAEDAWALHVTFDSHEPWSRELAEPEGQPIVATAPVTLAGGIDREFVVFTISAVSDTFFVTPLLLTMTVPAFGSSEAGTILLRSAPRGERPDEPRSATPQHPVARRGSVIIEVRQGTQTVLVAPAEIPL